MLDRGMCLLGDCSWVLAFLDGSGSSTSSKSCARFATGVGLLWLRGLGRTIFLGTSGADGASILRGIGVKKIFLGLLAAR